MTTTDVSVQDFVASQRNLLELELELELKAEEEEEQSDNDVYCVSSRLARYLWAYTKNRA
jgi:hypothetical protein